MNNQISIVALIVAVIAIAGAVINSATQTDTSDFVLKSDQKEFILAATGILDGIQEPCYQDSDCVKFFARKFVTEDQINPVINDLVAVDDQLRTEIVKNSDNFIDNHPFNFEPEEFEVVGEVEAFSTLLAITLERENWQCAQTVVFTGDAIAHGPQVQATVTEPDGDERYLNAIVYPTGEYRFSFGTPLGCELGEYSVFVEQGKKKSQTVSFTLRE